MTDKPVHVRLVPIFATGPDRAACQRHTRPPGELTSDTTQVTCPDCLAYLASKRSERNPIERKDA
jgi:hypothetical protein